MGLLPAGFFALECLVRITYIVSIVVSIENTAAITSDIRKVFVKDEKEDGANKTSLRNSLFTHIFWIT